jgi:hypothetical protein
MKRLLSALALSAALAQPASAITFPQLTTIYVGSGVANNGSVVATTLHCSNVSGVSAGIRFLFLGPSGVVEGTHAASLSHGQTYTLSTQDVPIFVENFVFDFIVLNEGVVNIESTNSAVFCTGKVVDPSVFGAIGFALPLVRVNPHPGTVE